MPESANLPSAEKSLLVHHYPVIHYLWLVSSISTLQLMKEEMKLILLEDHPLYREGLKSQIRAQFPFVEFIYEGADVGEAHRVASSSKVNIALVDLHLGDGRSPAEVVSTFSALKIPVLVISALNNFESVQNAFAMGARGFVSKDSPVTEIQKAIKAVAKGDEWISSVLGNALNNKSVKSKDELSPQERKALVLYASGLKLLAVARRMNVAPSTVKQYLERAKVKYRLAGKPIRTKTEMYKTLRDEGLID